MGFAYPPDVVGRRADQFVLADSLPALGLLFAGDALLNPLELLGVHELCNPVLLHEVAAYAASVLNDTPAEVIRHATIIALRELLVMM